MTAFVAGTLHEDTGEMRVSDVAVHPGESATFDRLMVMPKYSTQYISTATTTTIKTGAGVLHTIVVGTTAAGAITVYDNTAGSGTVLAVLKSGVAEGTYTFDISFATGLTIVTAAASLITVSYL